MSALHVWQGDLLGGEEVSGTPLIGANPLRLGYLATAYLFAPNALQGSVVSQRESYIASDCFNPGKEPESSGPCSFLLWRLDLDRNPRPTTGGRSAGHRYLRLLLVWEDMAYNRGVFIATDLL